MYFRKIIQASALAGMVAASSWASAASSESQAPANDQAKYAPVQSIRYDFGSKSVSGYFVEQAATCAVVLMVYEKSDAESAPTGTAARVRLALNPGQMAGLDSEEGRSLNFTCGEGANTLLVDIGERPTLTELQRLTSPKTASE